MEAPIGLSEFNTGGPGICSSDQQLSKEQVRLKVPAIIVVTPGLCD